jgi:hypothetical protein
VVERGQALPALHAEKAALEDRWLLLAEVTPR